MVRVRTSACPSSGSRITQSTAGPSGLVTVTQCSVVGPSTSTPQRSDTEAAQLLGRTYGILQNELAKVIVGQQKVIEADGAVRVTGGEPQREVRRIAVS